MISRFLNFINLLFIYYLGRGGGNNNNNNQESNGEGSRGKNLFLILDFIKFIIIYLLFKERRW